MGGMKKAYLTLGVLALAFSLTSCSIQLPYDTYEDYDGYRITMLVEPDDAEVLLNGRLIGLAYEFSTRESALRLASRNNELVIQKKGFIEEFIDLGGYTSRTITVRIKMNPDKRIAAKVPVPEERGKGELEPKTEPVIFPPQDRKQQEPLPPPTLVRLVVAPADTAIYLNGKFWGIAPETGKIENLRLQKGKYLFEAFKPGYKTFRKEFDIPKTEKFDININLEK
jgi:hypothetical protein